MSVREQRNADTKKKRRAPLTPFIIRESVLPRSHPSAVPRFQSPPSAASARPPAAPAHLFRFCFKSTWRNSRARTNFFKGVKTPECRRKDFILHFKFSSRRNYLFYNSQRMGWRRLPNVYIASQCEECLHPFAPFDPFLSDFRGTRTSRRI